MSSINNNMLSRIEQKSIGINRIILLHELFEEQAARMPHHIALSFEGETLTYKELNSKANSAARYLRGNGVVAGSIVAIMLQRSFEMIIGILSVLKAGGTYLPIDPEYPADRINFILEDSHASLIITDDELNENINLTQKKISIEVDIHDEEIPNLDIIISPNDLAYIIYTSGSAGKPKGVMIEHKSIANTILWRKACYRFDETDSILQLPSISFDSSVEDIFAALSSGASLVLLKQASRLNVKYLEKLIEDNNVTHFLTVPSFYKVLLEDSYPSFQRMRTIAIAGENFTSHLVKAHFNKIPHVRLFNEYGPTENSVCSTVYEFSSDKAEVLIGKPIDNVSSYVMDLDNQVVPVGEEGELCFSGTGLARGYLNRAELTAEKFIHNPFVAGELMYKTGDLVKQLPDGNIKFLGRIDYQIKIRGFRIELEEIEFLLQEYPGIENAVAIARENEDGSQYLCAYYTSGKEFPSNEIVQSLSKFLPEYMIPHYVARLDRIPLTPNGKIDRDALPMLDVAQENNAEGQEDKIDDLNVCAIEQRLKKLLNEVANPKASMASAYNESKIKALGIDSIGFIKLMAKVENEFQFEFDYDDLDNLLHPTINDLIAYIKQKTSKV